MHTTTNKYATYNYKMGNDLINEYLKFMCLNCRLKQYQCKGSLILLSNTCNCIRVIYSEINLGDVARMTILPHLPKLPYSLEIK